LYLYLCISQAKPKNGTTLKNQTKLPFFEYSTIEVLVAMPMTRWEFRIVPCLAGGNASATRLNMLVMRVADVQ